MTLALLPAAYHYLTTQEYLGQIVEDSDVPDPYVYEILAKVLVFTLLTH